MRSRCLLIGGFGLLAACNMSRADVRLIDKNLLDHRGMTLQANAPYGRAINGQAFQFDAITTFAGYQYAAYWVTDRSNRKTPYYLVVARRKLDGGAWEKAELTDAPFFNRLANGKPDDAHNVVSMGIDEIDGTIHLSYDMHVNNLNYRVSCVGAATHPESLAWTPSVFGPRSDSLGQSGPIESSTYPNFIRTPSNDLQMFIRLGHSGNGSTWVFDYDGKKHAWGAGRQIDNGSIGVYTFTDPNGKVLTNAIRNAYPNGYNYDSKGRLYTTWVWREGPPNGTANHGICFACSDDLGLTWKDNDGKTLLNTLGADGVAKQMTVNTPGLVVVSLDQYTSVMNTQAQALDHQDQLHMLMWHLDPGVKYTTEWDPLHSSYYHYWRDAQGTWKHSVISRAAGGGAPGSRPRMVFDADDNALAIYTVRTGRSVGSDSIYFLSEGELIVAEASKTSGWSDWKIVHTEPGPFVNEPLLDERRLRDHGVLSVMMQNSPKADLEPTDITVYSFAVGSTGEPHAASGQAVMKK